jgi:hypothetical protein
VGGESGYSSRSSASEAVGLPGRLQAPKEGAAAAGKRIPIEVKSSAIPYCLRARNVESFRKDPGYRIDLTARESTWPTPMITVSSSNQNIGVILVFIRHLLIGFVCRQTICILYTVSRGDKQAFPRYR